MMLVKAFAKDVIQSAKVCAEDLQPVTVNCAKMLLFIYQTETKCVVKLAAGKCIQEKEMSVLSVISFARDVQDLVDMLETVVATLASRVSVRVKACQSCVYRMKIQIAHQATTGAGVKEQRKLAHFRCDQCCNISVLPKVLLFYRNLQKSSSILLLKGSEMNHFIV